MKSPRRRQFSIDLLLERYELTICCSRWEKVMKRILIPVAALWIAMFVVSAQRHPAAQGRGGAPVNLPDGAGKELVQSTCSKCHSLGLVVNGFGYTRADWEKVIGSMVAIPQPDRDTVLTYL